MSRALEWLRAFGAFLDQPNVPTGAIIVTMFLFGVATARVIYLLATRRNR